MAVEFVRGFVATYVLQEIADAMKAVATDTISLYKSDIESELKNVEVTYVRAHNTLATIDGWDLIACKLHRDWLADTRRACYDVEDFMAHLKIEILGKIQDANFLSSFFTKVAASRKLRILQGNLCSLITESDSHHILRSFRSERRQRQADIKTQPVALTGRTEDKCDIVGFLLQTRTEEGTVSSSSSSSSSVKTVLISGMFGIGKTTLAQAVMNDPQIQGHFHSRLWVSLSREFNLRESLKSMVTNLWEAQRKMAGCRLQPPLPLERSDDWSDDEIMNNFKDLCKEKRILVVLDDLRSFAKPQEDWRTFEEILCGCSQAMFAVIITTRNPKVSTAVASLRGFPMLSRYLQHMSKEDCVSLILQKADPEAARKFFKRDCYGNTTFETNSLDIAEKFCKGLPLVADIIGRHLSLDLAEWSNMKPEDLWGMPEFREEIFPAFRLDYSDLCIVLRNCLPYFSLFPEGYKFNEDELVRLWLAEGFIRPLEAGFQYLHHLASEKLGSHVFDQVLTRSILQIDGQFDQEPQMYKMHEFIRRYAQYVGSDMYLRIDEQLVPSGRYCSKWVNAVTQLRKARHISIICANIPSELWKHIEKCEGLRTVLSLHKSSKIGELGIELFLKLQWLRVLMLSGTDINELPESLGKLKHLRLLDVSGSKIKKLPRSTVELYGLLVLKLNHCSQLLRLPEDLSNLTQLLHLEVDKRLSLLPPHIGKLRELRTLHTFKVGIKKGHHVTELKNMKYLKGSICLTNLENVRDEAEAREAKLSNKPLLKRVELEWTRNSTDQSRAVRILAGFEPHKYLEMLQVNGYGGAQFPSWISSPECNITSIHIMRCRQCNILPALGQLQHLKALDIGKMDQLKYIDHQFFGNGAGAGFPRLESLKLHSMSSLEKWSGLRTNDLPRLRNLVITDCPKLTSLPPLNLLISLVRLEITNCPAIKALPKEGLPLSLETLCIVQCDLLKQSCKADLEKIKTISDLYIDNEHISRQDHKRKLASL